MTLLAIVCQPPSTLLFGDRRYLLTEPDGKVRERCEIINVRDLSTGEMSHRPAVKVHAHRCGVVWATAGSMTVDYAGHECLTDDAISSWFDQLHGPSFRLDDLVAFLHPLVIERGKRSPGSVHVLLGTAAEAWYFWFPDNPARGPVQGQQITRKLIPSVDSAEFFGGWEPGSEFFPPSGEDPDAVVSFMRPLLERVIASTQERLGADGCDIAGPIDVALVDPGGARILEVA